MLLLGWQVVWFGLFTGLRWISSHPLPVATTIEVTVLAVMVAVFPAVVLLFLPWVWAVVIAAMVVTVAMAARQIVLWHRNSSGWPGHR